MPQLLASPHKLVDVYRFLTQQSYDVATRPPCFRNGNARQRDRRQKRHWTKHTLGQRYEYFFFGTGDTIALFLSKYLIEEMKSWHCVQRTLDYFRVHKITATLQRRAWGWGESRGFPVTGHWKAPSVSLCNQCRGCPHVSVWCKFHSSKREQLIHRRLTSNAKHFILGDGIIDKGTFNLKPRKNWCVQEPQRGTGLKAWALEPGSPTRSQFMGKFHDHFLISRWRQ